LCRGRLGTAENRDVQFVFRDGEPVGRGDQLPGVGDGFFLEVVAEGKIAKHLEKSVMALGEADIFEIVVFAAAADTFFARWWLCRIRAFPGEEDVLELVHPGVGEEQGGIAMRDERGTAHPAMAFALEETEEGFADFVAGPEFWLWWVTLTMPSSSP